MIVAFLEVLEEIIWLVELLEDTQVTNTLSHNLEYYLKTKSIHGHQYFISEMIKQKKIFVEYIFIKNIMAIFFYSHITPHSPSGMVGEPLHHTTQGVASSLC